MASRAIDDTVGVKRPDVILCTPATELVTATGSNSFLCWLVTDAADENVLPSLAMFLQNQIRVVGDLTHLHDQTENVGIIVQHNTPTDISVELPCGVGHDASRKVPLNFTKEFITKDNTFGALILAPEYVSMEVKLTAWEGVPLTRYGLASYV